MTTPHIIALLTCHNRIDRTLSCLESLRAQTDATDATLEVVLVDAGSTDGTGEAVRSRFPEVTVVPRGPELFWNAGMRVALGEAHRRDPDLYLWLNDDVVLDMDAVARLVAAHRDLQARRPTPCIVAGSTRDPVTGATTYGGVERPHRLRPLRYVLVEPGEQSRRVETMNGNAVLVPRAVVGAIGTLAGAYTHGMGDYDYGHRATCAGCEVWIAPGTIGTCARNPPRERSRSIDDYRRNATSPTGGLPPAEWFTFARRWAGPLWPVFAVSPYVRRFARWLAER